MHWTYFDHKVIFALYYLFLLSYFLLMISIALFWYYFLILSCIDYINIIMCSIDLLVIYFCFSWSIYWLSNLIYRPVCVFERIQLLPKKTPHHYPTWWPSSGTQLRRQLMVTGPKCPRNWNWLVELYLNWTGIRTVGDHRDREETKGEFAVIEWVR